MMVLVHLLQVKQIKVVEVVEDHLVISQDLQAEKV
jgi:hypothetical protein